MVEVIEMSGVGYTGLEEITLSGLRHDDGAEIMCFSDPKGADRAGTKVVS